VLATETEAIPPMTTKLRVEYWLPVTIVTMLLTELGIRLLSPLADPYPLDRWTRTYIRQAHEPHMRQRFAAEHGLPGMEGVTQWTTNNLGFRGAELVSPKPANEFRVFLIGGSTTECLILDDKDSLDAVIQRAVQERVTSGTQVRVYNAGVSGDRSDDHVAVLTQRIVHLEPDLVVVFAGINDLLASIHGHDYLHFPTPARPSWELFATQSQLGRLLYYVAALRRPVIESAHDAPLVTSYRFGAERQRAAPVASKPPSFDPRPYANNLRTLVGVAHGHGIALLFVTQQTTWASRVDPTAKDWHWLLRVDDVRYEEDAMDAALERMNDVMREIANSGHVALYDLARQMPKSTAFFYDDVHFNANGARVAGTEIARLIPEHR